eukprot:UN27890
MTVYQIKKSNMLVRVCLWLYNCKSRCIHCIIEDTSNVQGPLLISVAAYTISNGDPALHSSVRIKLPKIIMFMILLDNVLKLIYRNTTICL